jgi:hypothetical protein
VTYVEEADFVLWLVCTSTTEQVEREVRLAASAVRPRLLAFVLTDREAACKRPSGEPP